MEDTVESLTILLLERSENLALTPLLEHLHLLLERNLLKCLLLGRGPESTQLTLLLRQVPVSGAGGKLRLAVVLETHHLSLGGLDEICSRHMQLVGVGLLHLTGMASRKHLHLVVLSVLVLLTIHAGKVGKLSGVQTCRILSHLINGRLGTRVGHVNRTLLGTSHVSCRRETTHLSSSGCHASGQVTRQADWQLLGLRRSSGSDLSGKTRLFVRLQVLLLRRVLIVTVHTGLAS